MSVKRSTFNFFEAQAHSKSRTFYFACAFVVMAAILSAINSYVFCFIISVWRAEPGIIDLDLGPSKYFLITFAVHILFFVVAGWILFRRHNEGVELMFRLGGTQIDRLSGLGADEKKLMNVVEEMAIASGVPVPAIFCFRGEEQINAMAAGLSSQNFAIGVTQGCLNTLNRDELQGVIGHEFSHILNEDMNLQVRMLSSLYVFQWISIAGREIYQGTARVSWKGSNSVSGSVRLGIVLVGLVFHALGSIGYLMSLIMQSAISRQREFLADAASAQFTRNPRALAAALYRIWQVGSYSNRSSHLRFSHLFFSSVIRPKFFNLLTTHPPIAERIKRLDPLFKISHAIDAGSGSGSNSSESLLGLVGRPSAAQLESSREVIDSLAPLRSQLSSIEDVKIALFALALSFQKDAQKLLDQFKINPDQAGLLAELKKVVLNPTRRSQWALYQVIFEPLRNLRSDELQKLIDSVEKIIQFDQAFDFDECVLLCHLQGYFRRPSVMNPKPLSRGDEIKIRKLFDQTDFTAADYQFLKLKCSEIHALTRLQKKAFLERTFANLPWQDKPQQRYRLFCCAIGVPVPLI